MTIRRFAVMGMPVAHSLSPRLHSAGFAAMGWDDCRYEAIAVAAGTLAQAVQAFRRDGGQGLNVTRPLKVEAVRLAGWLDPWAAETGAVNTLYWRDGRLCGANTDAPALRDSLAVRGLRPERALIWGSGGAARASQAALRALGVDPWLAARRPGSFEGQWISWADARAACEEADLLVNATPLGQAGEAAWDPLPPVEARHTVVDWVYAPALTPLLALAEARGASRVSGLELLVRQASLSWVHWFGRAGPLEAMGEAVGWRP
jgi:shikimate dehydrogenase